jgi:ADP-ribose pyrophosphatase YjhB (NUDIX family)
VNARDPEHERTGVVVGCCNVIARDGSYLLVQETKRSARRRYNLPAGTLEVGETVVEAAERECQEETGLLVRVERLVGIYQCTRTSEGFAVVNFVFAAIPIGGQLASSLEHPEVAYFSRDEIAALAERRRLRGAHIERAIDAYEAGVDLPLSLVQVVEPSPLPVRPGGA